MSITTDCVDYISLHGPADGAQIAASLGITYEQALKALNNAKYLGRLETYKPAQALGRGKGRSPAVYRIPKDKQRLTAAFANRNSVWALAAA